MNVASLRITCVAMLVVFGAACQSQRAPGASAKPQPAVTHVVLVWLKTPGDAAGRERIVETSKTFRTIPGVVGVMAGRPLPSTRPVVDSSFDVAIVMTFEDESALRAYDVHPTHKRAVEDVLRPLVGKLLIYDVKAE
jgi:hypothetical protein